ncbi:MAG TPA: glycosyltransferase family 39 protein [Thermoanaerobaculia bacterium]|jgi:4-amino-4-deoxy-L-arabinose transferase-like glycosyltransferase|nr:glycosyltransferase family 39 protein [Thermoanaerobaculia bacterium]
MGRPTILKGALLPSASADPWLWRGLLTAALLVGALVRLPAVTAGYPYLEYVDEGHILHPVAQTLATGRWDPAQNNYPALPVLAIAGASRLLSPLAGVWRGAPNLDDVRSGYLYYDQVEPPQLMIVGRGLSLLVSLASILLAGLLGRRFAGDAAGGLAALAAALLPALVFRGALVIVDVYAAFFVLAALTLLAGVERPDQLARLAAAGACCGLAAVSKYPAVLVSLVVVAAVLLAPWRWRERLRGAALAGAAAVLAAAIVMPALWRDPLGVWTQQIARQSRIYSSLETPSYGSQAFGRVEWDLPRLPYAEMGYTFTILALAGLTVLIARPASRRFGIGCVLFTAALISLHAMYTFQAFRNLLPVAALACVTTGVAIATVGERLRWPRLTALIGAALLVAIFGPAARDYALERARLVDSRRQAMDWIAAKAPGGASVVIVEETAVPNGELARLRGRVRALPWPNIRRAVRQGKPRFLLAPDLVRRNGQPLISEVDRRWLLDRYALRATFGSEPAGAINTFWRGNHLRVFVLERRPDWKRRNG